MLSRWDFPMRNSGCSPQEKPAATGLCYATQPMVHAGCFSIFIIHRTPTWTTGSLTCMQMLMHVIAQGGAHTIREFAPKVDSWGKNPLPHWRTEPVSAECQPITLPTKLHPNSKTNRQGLTLCHCSYATAELNHPKLQWHWRGLPLNLNDPVLVLRWVKLN